MLSFARIRAELESGTRSPRDFLEECIATIEQRDGDVGAFVAMDLTAARKAADAAGERYRAGRTLSSIDGMPVGVKDIINTADLPTQMNSDLYAGWRPGWDAACVAALKAGGAIPFGKTVTTEFACGDPGKTRNPRTALEAEASLRRFRKGLSRPGRVSRHDEPIPPAGEIGRNHERDGW